MLLTHYLNGKTTFLLFSFQFVLIVTRGRGRCSQLLDRVGVAAARWLCQLIYSNIFSMQEVRSKK
jgi:hypothetical protein